MFITIFTKARHLSLFWDRPIQSMPPHITSWISILILSSHLFLGLPSVLFLSGLPTKTQRASLLSHMRAMCPVHPILLDLIKWTIFSEQYRSLSSSLSGLLQSPITSSRLSPNIFLSTLFSNTLRLCYSLNVRDQSLRPYKATGKITFLYTFSFTWQNWETNVNPFEYLVNFTMHKNPLALSQYTHTVRPYCKDQPNNEVQRNSRCLSQKLYKIYQQKCGTSKIQRNDRLNKKYASFVPNEMNRLCIME